MSIYKVGGDQNGTSHLCCPSILKNCQNQPKRVSDESLHLYVPIWVLKFTLCSIQFLLDPAKVAPFQLKEILSFLSKNGEYLQFFDLHTQYLHQMKAQTILYSNLIPKMIFLDQKYFEKFDANWIICNFCLKFHKKIFLECTIFEKKIENPKILWFSLLLNTRNEIYTKISDP